MLFINAKILTMENKNYDNGYLEISDTKIKAIGNMSELYSHSKNVYDMQGALLLPGFIDAHCHIGMWEDGLGFEGDDGNEETDPVTPHLRAIDAVNPFDRCFSEALDAGITTVLTGPGSANPIAGEWCAMKTHGICIDDMIIKAPVGMKFALGENPKSIYNEKSQSPATRMATAALIREQLKKTLRYIEDKRRTADDEELDPPEYDIKCESLIPVLEGKVKAFFHAHRADDIQTAIRIAKEFHLDYVIIHATEGYRIAPLLKKEKASIITGPIICDRSKPELKNQTAENTSLLLQAGIDTAICTDHPENPIQYLPLAAEICMKAGLPYENALKSITINAAKIVGIDNHVGSLAQGKDADILIFKENPLDVMNTPNAVILNGKIIRGSIPLCGK